MSAPTNGSRTHRLLAVTAAVLAIGALAAGEPRAAGGRIDVDALARTVEAEEDHVTAVELAAWIRDRKPGLRVVDVRVAGTTPNSISRPPRTFRSPGSPAPP